VPRLMRGAIPPLSQFVFMAWCLVKHRDNFYLYLSYIKLFIIGSGMLLHPVLFGSTYSDKRPLFWKLTLPWCRGKYTFCD